MAVKSKEILNLHQPNTTSYVYHSHFINKDDKRKVQWFDVRIVDNKSLRSFQKHEVHIPRDAKNKDIETIKQSVIDYVLATQSIYEKY